MPSTPHPSSFSHQPSNLIYLRFPKKPTHIHMPVGFKLYALFLQQCPMPTPPRCRTSLFIHYPMTG